MRAGVSSPQTIARIRLFRCQGCPYQHRSVSLRRKHVRQTSDFCKPGLFVGRILTFFLNFNFGGFVLFSEKASDSGIDHANPAMCNVFHQWKNKNWTASSCEHTQGSARAWKSISTLPNPLAARVRERKGCSLGINNQMGGGQVRRSRVVTFF